MPIICPKCHGMNVRQVTKPKKTKYGRIHRKFQCKDRGHYWIGKRWDMANW